MVVSESFVCVMENKKHAGKGREKKNKNDKTFIPQRKTIAVLKETLM